ncbi:MAG: hypothetical protein IJ091_08370 [Oscillospiraceae bacterium]|nr:hypothetical protein [Oscillospiraceae bacterium]
MASSDPGFSNLIFFAHIYLTLTDFHALNEERKNYATIISSSAIAISDPGICCLGPNQDIRKTNVEKLKG